MIYRSPSTVRCWLCVLAALGLSAVLILAAQATAQEKTAGKVLGLPLLYEAGFEDAEVGGVAADWKPADSKAWKIGEKGDEQFYSQFKASNYKPTHRSPVNYTLLKDHVVGDFVLEVRVQSTRAEYGHRDACFFFGHQDPDHFYYVHIATKADDHANQIFIVNGAPRTKISKTSTAGTRWSEGWHNVRIVRRVEPGTIEVYFDDMKKPIMTAVDKTFTHGQVGFGTFDDTANFDDFKLYGVKRAVSVERTKEPLESVQRNLADKKAVLVDVREKREWDEGHVAGAIFLPLSELKKETDANALGKQLPKDAIIYTHCRSGVRSLAAGRILAEQGYNVRPLKPGYEELLDAGFKKAED
ncbi:MAG: rhodanese-like domain-containing protein [Pirellulales bacterium]